MSSEPTMPKTAAEPAPTASPPPSLTARLGAWVAALEPKSIPEDARHAARRCLVDWFAALLPGAVVAPATLLRAGLVEEMGTGAAVLYPDGARASARLAALVNGSASHTVEFDDIFRDAIYHPGCPVIAAALAIAQSRGRSGAALLEAVVAGYEISNRIGVAVVPSHYEHWHTTGTVGTFGAAAAAARALGLDAAGTGHALATAASFAAGLQQAFRSDAMTKPLHAGRAAEGGVLAALAAGAGITGAEGMLEGERGFGAAMSTNPDWETPFADLGTLFQITRTTQKNHGCCGHSFAALDGIIGLRERHGLDPEVVSRIRVGTYGKALEIVGNRRPVTPYEAKFSLAYCAAVALTEGRVRLASFAPERLADPRLCAIMERVELELDPECDRRFPGRRSAVVTLETRDGRHLEERVPTRKGDPENPLSDAELEAKFTELAEPVIGAAGAGRLLERLWTIDGMDDVSQLRTDHWPLP